LARVGFALIQEDYLRVFVREKRAICCLFMAPALLQRGEKVVPYRMIRAKAQATC
jgi:hypothetical protein